MKQIQIKDVTILNQLNHININLISGEFYVILGTPMHEEKSVISIFDRSISYEGKIIINEIDFQNYQKNIGIIPSKFVFTKNSVKKKKKKDSIAFKKKSLLEILSFFNLNHYLHKNVLFLSNSQKALLSFIRVILKDPDFLILDDCFTRMDSNDKEKCIEFLKKWMKTGNKIILYYTNDVEDILLGTQYLLFDRGNLLKIGNHQTLISDEKYFHNIGYDLPFILDLSHKLSYYNLVKEPIFNIEEMIQILWKLK